MLDKESRRALKADALPVNRSLHVSSDLAEEELSGSAFVNNATALLRAAVDRNEDLRAKSNGTLSLASVSRMSAETAWPDMEAMEHFRGGTRYRERNLREPHVLQLTVREAGLVERGVRALEPTEPGRSVLEAGRLGTLQALPFQAFL